jgi:hypothetical protein
VALRIFFPQLSTFSVAETAHAPACSWISGTSSSGGTKRPGAMASANQSSDWSKLPRSLVDRADAILTTAGNPPGLTLEETIVLASVNDSRDSTPQDAKLRDWLTNWLDRQPSYDVKVRARKPRRRSIRCRACAEEIAACPRCSAPLTAAAEKGVDAALVTDLLSLAWQRAYDVAVLVSAARPGGQGEGLFAGWPALAPVLQRWADEALR